MDLKQKIDFQEEVESFLDQYNVYDLFDSLLKELLIDRPTEPLDYLIHKLSHKPRRRLFLIGGIGQQRRQISREMSYRFQIDKVFLLDLLKAEVRKTGKWAQEIQHAWNSGTFVPDHIILDFMMPVIEDLEKKGVSYILEGFPRTRVQALALQRAGVIPDRIVLMVSPQKDFKQAFADKLSELASAKPENASALSDRAWQEFEYHTRGLHAAYGAQIHTLEAMGEVSSISTSIYKVFLAKGRNKAPRKPPRVVVLGPPGSGRSTLSKTLANTYGLTFISTEQLLRHEINTKTETGRNISAMMHIGEKVPDATITELVRLRIEAPDARLNGWILDGFPKNMEQVRSLKEFRIRPTHVMFLDCPDALVYERVEQRRLDPERGVYYSVMNMPQEEEVRNRLVQMNEDTHEVVKKRLMGFKQEAMQIRSEYSGIAVTIKADMDLEAVADIAKEAIVNSIPHDID